MLPAWWLSVMTLGSATGPTRPADSVAVVPFCGGEARELEREVVHALEGEGLTLAPPPSVPPEATGCDESPLPSSCVKPIVERWRAEPSTSRFLVLGSMAPTVGGTALEVQIFDREAVDGSVMTVLQARAHAGDLILPLVFPGAVARALTERLHPPPPPTPAELEALEQLDEPEPPLPIPIIGCRPGCCYPVEHPVTYDAIDLRDEFEIFCRVGPPRRRASIDDPVDLRPVCRRGPVLGYVRPRTWAAASLLAASSGATALAFGLRAAGWDTAGIDLGDHRLGAPLTTWGTAAAITTGALAVGTVVLAILDRRRARRFILREKLRLQPLDATD